VLTTFDRYLIKRYLHAFVILFISTYGLYVVIDGFTNADEFQKGKESTIAILGWMAVYYGFQSIEFFDLLAPFLSMMATMVVFALLHKNSEIFPVLAAGVPIYRLALPVVVGVMLVNTVAIVNQECVIPRVAPQLRGERAETEQGDQPVEPLYDRARIHIGGSKLSLIENRLEDAEFILPPGLVRELTALKSPEAIFLPERDDRPGGWLLRDVHPSFEDIPLTDRGRHYIRQTNRAQDVFVLSDVSIDQLTNRARNYQYLSTRQLLHRIRHPSPGLVSIRSQTLYFHNRLVLPLVNVLTVFVIVPLVLRRESRSLVTNMALCALFLGVLYGAGQLFQYLGHARLMAPDLAVWAAAVLNGSVGAWLSDRVQT